MADYIDRGFALSQVPEYFTSIDELTDVPFFLKSMPSVDAVEVVRCKDCKHTTKSSADKVFVGKLHCRFTGICVDDDFFCKWGEKE